MYQTFSHALPGRIDLGQSPRIKITLIGAGLLVPAIYFSLHGQFSLLAALMSFAVLLIWWLLDRTIAFAATFYFLFTLGDLRRIVDMVGGSPGLDPILLVGAVFSIYLAVPLLLRLKLTDNISKAVTALMAMMFLQIFNPRQGPIIVGFSGALFYIVPLLWFWIGRRYATDRILSTLIYKVIIPLGVAAALLGMYQTFIGFLPWEAAWVERVKSTLNSLYISGHIRSFGFSASTVEYGVLLQTTAVFLFGAVLAKRRVFALLLPLIGTAMVLASMRTAIVKLVFSFAIMWALRTKGRAWLPRFVFGLVIGAGALIYSVSQAAGGGSAALSTKSSTAQAATSHVTEGLAHPLDSKSSTAGVHWQIFVQGILRGFTYPIGMGLGSVTLGSGKFGGDKNVGTSEIDISDAFTSMGFVGGLLFLYVIAVGLRLTLRYVRATPLAIGLPILGMLTAMIGGWIPLGQYAMGPLMWFVIGHITKSNAVREERDDDLAVRGGAALLDEVAL